MVSGGSLSAVEQAKSGSLILLQTKGVLTRPWCLLEVYWATRCRIPIVPVFLSNGGYDYEASRRLLADLRTGLASLNPGPAKRDSLFDAEIVKATRFT